MKYQYEVNGQILGTKDDKDSAIKAARKATLKLPIPKDSLLFHISVKQLNAAEDDYKIVHHDLVFSDDLSKLNTDDLSDILTISTKGSYDIVTKVKPAKLKQVGEYYIIDNELYRIKSVSESRATAEPVKRKKVEMLNKLTEKKAVFYVRRRGIPLSPLADESVLSPAQVKKELEKLQEPIQTDVSNNSARPGDKLSGSAHREDKTDHKDSSTALPGSNGVKRRVRRKR
jgi:hypothetical protein